MTEEPQRFSLRPLRYIEPGSDSPWKEVFGTQSDGTHRPQYYSQLELPKVLELLRKYCTTWLAPEQARSRAREALWTFTSKSSSTQVSGVQALELLKTLGDALEARSFEGLKVQTFKSESIKTYDAVQFAFQAFLDSLAEASSVQALAVTSPKSTSVQVSASEYFVTLFFIFVSAEGKALARATLKLYTILNASGSVVSTTLFEHKKGFSEIGLASSVKQLYLRRLLVSSSSALSLLWLVVLKKNSGSVKVSSTKRLRAFKHQGSGASCRSQISLEYIGYGRGPYGYGLYGV